jgi:hypothetical protein
MTNLVCSNCKAENPPDNLFCQSCGTSLQGVKPDNGEKTVMAPRGEAVLPPTQAEPKPEAVPPSPAMQTATPPPVSAAVPPPPPILPPVLPTQSFGTPIHKLGVRMDNWSELIEGEAAAAPEVTRLFVEEIGKAKLEGVKIAAVDLTSGASGARKYQVVENGKGATVAVRFAPVGNDLLLTWDLFTRRTTNWLLIGIVGGVAFLLALIWVIVNRGAGFFYGLVSLVNTFLGLILVPGFGLLLLGKLKKDDIWGYYVNDLDDFAMDDANALGILVDDAATRAVETIITESPK